MPPATSHASKKRKACDATQLIVAATKAAQVIDVLIPNEVGQAFSNHLEALIASQPPQTPSEVPLPSILCFAVLPYLSLGEQT